MDALDAAIREFTPADGDWRPLEGHIERAFSSPDPKKYYPAMFNLFERFPKEDGAGVFFQLFTAWKRWEDTKSCCSSIFEGGRR